MFEGEARPEDVAEAALPASHSAPSPPGFAAGEGRGEGGQVAAREFPPHPHPLASAKPGARGVRGGVGGLPRESALLALVVLLMLAIEWQTGGFFTAATMGNLAVDTVLLGCVAVGAALVILAGGIDISLGALMAPAPRLPALSGATVRRCWRWSASRCWSARPAAL